MDEACYGKLESIETCMGWVHTELQTLNKNLILTAKIQAQFVTGDIARVNVESCIFEMEKNCSES